MKRRRSYQKRYVRRQRAGGIKHLKDAIKKRASDSAHRIGKHIINRKLGETFKGELKRTSKEVRKHPWKTLKTAHRLLRAK